MGTPIYQIKACKQTYKDKTVLDIDRLDINATSIVGLVGPNGSGKSTLLKLLGFIHSPTNGQILFDGKPAYPFADSVRFQVTLLTQEPYLMKRDVFKNIAYGLKLRGDDKHLHDRVNEALSMVGLKGEHFLHRQWYALSGGEAQRVALAARLILKPKVLLMDEPTASVDAASSELIRDAALKARKEWGTTLVIASHDKDWLYTVCDDVIHLFRGKPARGGKGNIIFGPWHDCGNGRYEKQIQNGHRLFVGTPPHDDAVAFIEPASITISLKDQTEYSQDFPGISGKISRMTLEKQQGTTLVDVMIGSQTLSASISLDKTTTMGLYPGRRVTLHYDPKSIDWQSPG